MRRIEISLAEQSLTLLNEAAGLVYSYPVSTSKNGPGETKDSFCTPRGRHIIRAKIGAGVARNTIFIGRRPSGEIYTPALGERLPGRDWILTRILWLSGCEPGFNRLSNVDTMQRYIYIHGSPDSAQVGKPSSIGCIRMHNRDIVELFDQVAPGTPVDILET
jgi:lipoprotein-anchoring transpeptidase ErfK/SrfK